MAVELTQRDTVPLVETEMAPGVDLYMIRTARYQPVLFLSRRALDAWSRSEGNQIRRFIRRLIRHRNVVVRWVGRVTRTGYRLYQKLEDRIDPLERMVKALNGSDSFRVHYATSGLAENQFRDFLRGQVVKHTAWLFVDAALTTVAVAFAWVLVPIPGPNIFFYYPALRLMSHYRAMTGARRVLNLASVRYEALPALGRLEARLRGPAPRDFGGFESEIDIRGLEHFLNQVA